MTQLFPFGQPLQTVTQADRSPKPVFILGTHPSAVTARWISPTGQELTKALPIASEPSMFWNGENAAEIVGQIVVPPELGQLLPAYPAFNGLTGRALDRYVLDPLHLGRKSAWFCDLVPHACLNSTQLKTIAAHYTPVAQKHGLPPASIPAIPDPLTDAARRAAILAEIRESRANTLILLGDSPIRWFLHQLGQRAKRLRDFSPYGQPQSVMLEDLKINVLPLVHPRQAARTDASSKHWADLHARWLPTAREIPV